MENEGANWRSVRIQEYSRADYEVWVWGEKKPNNTQESPTTVCFSVLLNKWLCTSNDTNFYL